ncbi:uncharacterized protein [Physeter macrocephalus]|uniref:Uncharacterized protein n=1 Tax=Physeter macrocephalus TaxID=9755 RepID=A0A455AV37_PHYMC|nr:uncharacterized protein LOC114484852 [Physeter catodon]|eukprot:XP_028339743.1 uncharacterized protein LOC114484852 [Physeter catodon]
MPTTAWLPGLGQVTVFSVIWLPAQDGEEEACQSDGLGMREGGGRGLWRTWDVALPAVRWALPVKGKRKDVARDDQRIGAKTAQFFRTWTKKPEASFFMDNVDHTIKGQTTLVSPPIPFLIPQAWGAWVNNERGLGIEAWRRILALVLSSHSRLGDALWSPNVRIAETLTGRWGRLLHLKVVLSLLMGPGGHRASSASARRLLIRQHISPA